MVTWVAVSLASLVRGLGVGVWGFCLYVGAVAPDMVVGCRLRLLGQQSRRLAWCAALGSAWMPERRLRSWLLGVGYGLLG